MNQIDFNEILISIENGQLKQAVEQANEYKLDYSSTKEYLEDYRTTYGVDYKKYSALLWVFMYIFSKKEGKQ